MLHVAVKMHLTYLVIFRFERWVTLCNKNWAGGKGKGKDRATSYAVNGNPHLYVQLGYVLDLVWLLLAIGGSLAPHS